MGPHVSLGGTGASCEMVLYDRHVVAHVFKRVDALPNQPSCTGARPMQRGDQRYWDSDAVERTVQDRADTVDQRGNTIQPPRLYLA